MAFLAVILRAMSTEPPAHPAQEDTWLDANGDLNVFRGSTWVLYAEVPDGAFGQPEAAVKEAKEATEDSD